ncbi:hypothetical protein AYO22_08440 [Fonsecaea multimorphosa]|nr:hypothetical protein AYO22_08440 [Fonsecaea multimorphosa]
MADHSLPTADKEIAKADFGDEVTQADSIATINALVIEDHSHEIKLRTMSWKKAAWLLCGDQVGLAIMAQAWSLSVLGWVPWAVTTILAGSLFWVTSMTMHKYLMKYPQIRDICDFGFHIFGRSRVAYWVTAFMLLANNILLIGFHVLTGAKVLNVLSDHSQCSVVFAVIVMIMGILTSITRTLHHISIMSLVSVEKTPLHGYHGDYPTARLVKTYAFPLLGTTWVDCMNATLNVTFLWVPQILFPQFIAEMERPQDFPKALAVLLGVTTILFTVPPAISFHLLGQYSVAPAFGSLRVSAYEKASSAFVIVPTLVIGIIYSNTTAKFIYHRVLGTSRHTHSHTVVGWAVWGLIVSGVWILSFIFAEVIPSMGDFLSLLSAAFDSFFGYIFFAICYWQLYQGRCFQTFGRSVMTLIHIFVMIVGLFILGPGLYAAVKAIVADYSGATSPAFSCADVSF